MEIEGKSKSEKVLKELKQNYADLLRIQNQNLKESVTLRLQTIQKRLEDIFGLLNAW